MKNYHKKKILLWKSIKIWVKNHPPSAATSSPTAQNTHVRWISITYTYANFLSLSLALWRENFPFFSAHSKIPHCCCGGLKTLNDDWRKLALAAAEEIFLLSLVSLFLLLHAKLLDRSECARFSLTFSLIGCVWLGVCLCVVTIILLSLRAERKGWQKSLICSRKFRCCVVGGFSSSNENN